jgi:2,4-dienoyl-CoA reductase-like NADH-dependent reductase (Old Yellow Enzyme family)
VESAKFNFSFEIKHLFWNLESILSFNIHFETQITFILKFKTITQVITRGDADLVALGRELLHDPFWPVRARHFLR